MSVLSAGIDFRLLCHSRFPGFSLVLFLLSLTCSIPALSQSRDFQTGRVIIDDNGDDGTLNTMIIQTPSPLGRDVIVTIPDMGSDSAQFLLAPPGATGAWLLDGNSGTASENYVGTSDTTPLRLYVNAGAGNSLILNTNNSIQRDTGGNARGAYATDWQRDRDSAQQVASGDFAVIAGGSWNTASDDYATVGGGLMSTASGKFSTVGGGLNNTTSGQSSTVSGGVLNVASGLRSTVGGGEVNVASGDYSTVAGGFENTATGQYSAILGGRGLTFDASAYSSVGFLAGGGGNPEDAALMLISTPNVAVFGNTELWLANTNGTAGRLHFYESHTGISFPEEANYTSFEAGSQTADIRYILPTDVPDVGQVLTTSAVTSGTPNVVTLSWEDGVATSIAPSGPEGGMEKLLEIVLSQQNLIELQGRRIAALQQRLEKLEGADSADRVDGIERESVAPPQTSPSAE